MQSNSLIQDSSNTRIRQVDVVPNALHQPETVQKIPRATAFFTGKLIKPALTSTFLKILIEKSFMYSKKLQHFIRYLSFF